ncbi:MAG TPA: NAD(P)H-hydrate dehydratase [Gaiellaceae bacterium]
MWTEPLYTADEMRAAEAAYDGPTLELMERAGSAAAESARRRYPEARSASVWCGGGANGGDGFVVARKLREAGLAVEIVLVGDEQKIEGDAAENLARVKELEIPFVQTGGGELAVDALFGTGFSGNPREPAAQRIQELSRLEVPILSVDVPSGVDASTGEVAGPAVEADATVTFHGLKLGLLVAPGRFHAGEVEVVDIGLPPGHTRHEHVTSEILAEVPRRGPGDNKYTAGSVLVVGGSAGKTGAPCLSAEAALRAGAGIVTVCGPGSLSLVFETRLLEVMSRSCPDEDGVMTMDAADEILDAAEKARAVALGPGLGRTDGARALVGYLLDRLDKPLVLDADGLWALAGHLDWVFSRDAATVLTPHSGELARLLGRESAAISKRRLDSVQAGADDVGAVVLLKGADTLVASPGKGVLVSDFGNPGLATAGSGDVLTGIVAAFLAKGMSARVAAAAAAAAAGEAARHSSKERGTAGMIASDVVEALSPVLSR